jgi:hypothetical protein
MLLMLMASNPTTWTDVAMTAVVALGMALIIWVSGKYW